LTPQCDNLLTEFIGPICDLFETEILFPQKISKLFLCYGHQNNSLDVYSTNFYLISISGSLPLIKDTKMFNKDASFAVRLVS
jgi:hypothetical protein